LSFLALPLRRASHQFRFSTAFADFKFIRIGVSGPGFRRLSSAFLSLDRLIT
jgi:hypothetical protein